MVEVPEHLLERSRARRAALGLLSEGDAGAAAPPATEGAEPATATAAPAVKAPAAPAPAVPETPPPPPPPYVKAALDRKKIPWWALSTLLALPLWAVLYAGSMSPAGETSSALAEGAALFTDRGCGGCHGATGGGGVGPAFTEGAVIQTFPNRADHMLWVYLGAAGWPAETYGAQGKTPANMPGHPSLTPEELLLIVRHERETLGGEDPTAEAGTTVEPGEVYSDELFIDGVPALEHYFGEGAAEGFQIGAEGRPVIEGAELSG